MTRPSDRRQTKERRKTMGTDKKGVFMGRWKRLEKENPSWWKYQWLMIVIMYITML
jgi:hypothetical protein